MGKKKKKSGARNRGADKRGYSSGAVAAGSAARNVQVTSKAHEGLTSLLGELTTPQQQQPEKSDAFSRDDGAVLPRISGKDLVPARNTIPSSWKGGSSPIASVDPASGHFLKKVTILHDKLSELSFTENQIKAALQAMSSSCAEFNLESALDWLCLNLASEELPPLFAEVGIRISALSSEGGISVVKAAQQSETKNEAGFADSIKEGPADGFVTMMAKMEAKKERLEREDLWTEEVNLCAEKDDEANKKAWLLQQYQYVDDSDSDSKAPVEVEPDENDVEDHCEMSPDERRLAELEKQISEDTAALNDDVANYMRSKHEIAELRKQLKRAEGQARGLRAKVAKIRAAKAKVQAKDNERKASEQHTENDGNLFSLFDDDDDGAADNAKTSTPRPSGGLVEATPKQLRDSDTTTPQPSGAESPPNQSTGTNTTKSQPPRKAVATDTFGPSIPKGWTGYTPKTILEEWCQKRKLKRPQFQQLKGAPNGCRVVVPREPPTQKGKGKKPIPPEKALIIERKGPYYSFADAQHFVSTEALYELNPNLPLYRLFPPVFSDLWKSWTNEVEAKKEAAIKEKQDEKDKKMKNLVQSILAGHKDTPTQPTRADAKEVPDSWGDNSVVSQSDERMDAEEVPDSWDDNSADAQSEDERMEARQLPSQSHDHSVLPDIPSDQGRKLRARFISHKKSPRYAKMAEERKSLPMHSYRKHLLDSVRENQVTVLCAQTGAGKTTQCPQFLLEEAFLSGFGDKVSIICTQPRRISAISVAERVADEMCEEIGESVGYQIRMETKRSSRTKLMFCTTGIVLRRLQDDPNLTGVTHIVIDEVHERQWQIDFLLIVTRKLINTTRKDLKVILMSATLDSKLFCSFYHNAPFLSVPGRTFPVSEYFLEDLLDATDHIIEDGSKCALWFGKDRRDTASLWVTGRGGEKRKEIVSLESELHSHQLSDDYLGYKLSTRRSMERVNEQIINFDLIEDVLNLLLIEPQENVLSLPTSDVGTSSLSAAVLVFLPGLGEIRTLSERLRGSYKFGDRRKFDVIPMHSTLSPKDQRRAFLRPKGGCRKIILATNICETSITIPDVAYVIDSGLVREVRRNERTGTSTLVTDWCSKASAKQRSGRAGRVQAGICCKLFSSRTATRVMKEQAMPELQRVPLEEVCLSVLAGNMADNCLAFLLQAPQPPSEEAVQTALTLLEEVGAINGSPSTSLARTEQLTPLGNHLAKLPVHVRLGKMLIFGALFRCLDKVLTVAAALSCSRSPFFTTSMDDAQQAAAHRTFAHPTSDFMTLCNVWDTYRLAATEGTSQVRMFCDRYYLNRTAFVEISDLRNHFLSLLSHIGFVKGYDMNAFEDSKEMDTTFGKFNTNGKNESIVGAVICAGLYPNIAHAVKTSAGGVPALWHRSERLYFHKSSVNHKKAELQSEWVAFYEKFATSRVYISATSLVNPFSILVFGRSVVVKHLERKAVVDDWIELNVAAQTGVMFRELRHEVETLLKDMIENVHEKCEKGYTMIDGIVNLLASE